jgi:hypothetical protein
MKRWNYSILKVVGIVAMVLMPFSPCRAGWTYLGSSVSSGLPPYDWEQERGSNYWWKWLYFTSGINRGADSGGSWAEGYMEAKAYAYAYSYTSEATSVSPYAEVGISAWGDSYYQDLPPYDEEDLEYDYSTSASGDITVWGYVDDSDLGAGDTLYSGSFADGYVQGDVYGMGYAGGYVEEYSTGSAYAGVDGAGATGEPETDTGAGYYNATLSFSVSVSDSDSEEGGQGNYFTSVGEISVYSGAEAEISSSLGYSGSAYGSAEIEFSGEASVVVYMP